MRRLLLITLAALASAVTLPAACTKIANGPPERWHCANTGDPAADGLTMYNFLGTPPWSGCAIIEVEPGYYLAPQYLDFNVNPGYPPRPTNNPVHFVPQAGCTGTGMLQKTMVIPCTAADSGNCATSRARVPKRPNAVDLPNMIVFQQSDAGSAGGFYTGTVSGQVWGQGNQAQQFNFASFGGLPGSNNYYFESIAPIGNADASDIGLAETDQAAFSCTPRDVTTDPTQYCSNIEVNKAYVAPGEQVRYGNLAGNRDQRRVYVSVGKGMQLSGSNIYIHDSRIEGFGGYYPGYPAANVYPGNPIYYPITSCTSTESGAATYCNAPGIATALGLNPNSAAVCAGGPDSVCAIAGGATYLSFGGGTGNWTALNGHHYAYYVGDADHIGIASSYRLSVSNPIKLNSSTFGPFTGTSVTGRAVGGLINVGFSVLITQLWGNSAFTDNTVTGQEPGFVSSAGNTTATGYLDNGSTQNTFSISNVTGQPPAINDVVSVSVSNIDSNPPSVWCQNGPNVTCGYVTWSRAAKVTSVTNNSGVYTGTWVPQGPDGIDVPPLTGATGCGRYRTNSVAYINGAVLVEDLNDTTTTAHISTGDPLDIGGGGLTFGFTNTGEFIRVTADLGGGFYTIARAQYGSTATSHSAGVRLYSLIGYQCKVQWNGYQGANETAIIGNTFAIESGSFPQGKDDFEWKSCRNCLVDGNQWDGYLPSFFLESVSQGTGGGDTRLQIPWSTGLNLQFTNNAVVSPEGSHAKIGIISEYYETTTRQGENTWIANNLFPNVNAYNQSNKFMVNTQGTSGGIRHNTWTVNTAASLSPWTWLQIGVTNPGRFYNNDYLQVPDGFYVKDNITSYGVGVEDNANGTGFNPSVWLHKWAWQEAATNINHNLFIIDTSPYFALAPKTTALSYFPLNNADSAANVGLTSCYGPTYASTCKLPSNSAYRGTASDGGDPGADIDQLQDHVQGWSRAAGLITYDTTRTVRQWRLPDDGAVNGSDEAQWIRNPANWTMADDGATATFTITNAIGSCSVHLYTDKARTIEHADTGSGNSACNRTGNTVVGSNVTFKFGNHSPLSSDTTYFPLFTDGSRIMTAVPFTTNGAPTPPTITSTSPIPNCTVGAACSYTFSATGSTPITWTGTGLPAGLSLSTAGALSGTPTTALTYTMHITASNTSGTHGPIDFMQTINAAGIPPTITSTTPLPAAVVGQAYSYQFTASGSTPISWSATGVPSGLTLTSTGLLSGTPTTPAVSTISVTATNAAGSAGPTDFFLTTTVVPGPGTSMTGGRFDGGELR